MRVFAAFLVLHLTGCVYLLEKPRNESWKSEAQLAASRPSDSALVEPSQAEAQFPGAPAVTPPGQLKQVVDVDEIPALGVQERENAYAVVIGIEQYRERLPKADYSANDARIMGEYLTKVLGYPEKNVVVRVNEKAAKADLEKYFGPWLRNNVDPGSSVFVFYSGHGAPNPKTGDAYLVPYDGDPTYVETTAYSLKRLYADLASLPAKEVVVMVDSCFSGAGGRSVIAKGTKPVGISVEGSLRPWGKIKVLAASTGDQISLAYEEKGHGLFTYYVLRGLQEAKYRTPEGSLKLKELFEFVRPQVERVARKQYNSEQTPQLMLPHGLQD